MSKSRRQQAESTGNPAADSGAIGSGGHAREGVGDDGEGDYTNGVLTSIFSTDGALGIGGADTISGPLVNGFVDVLATEDDGATLIVDYKSHRLDDGTDTQALIDRDYAIQRLLKITAASPTVAVVGFKFDGTQTCITYDNVVTATFRLGDDTRHHKSMLLLEDKHVGAVGVLQQMNADWVGL